MVETLKARSRITKEEVALLENTFKDNYELLITVRKVFWQHKLTKVESEIIKATFHGQTALIAAMKRFFAPRLKEEADSPINIIHDLWTQTANEIRESETMDAYQQIRIRKILFDYMEQQLVILGGEDVDRKFRFNALEKKFDKSEVGDFTSLPEEQMVEYLSFMARHQIITHIEQKLGQIYIVARQNIETPEETIKRLGMNSSK